MNDQELREAFKDPHNVVEAAALYDTILVCNKYYGSEINVRGWYTSFAAFAAAQDMRFFKVRTEGTAGLPYTNQQSADSMEFPFMAYSMGLAFFAPASNMMGNAYEEDMDGAGDTVAAGLNPGIPHFWQFDLPSHAAIALKTNQDVRAEVTAYACPPGYGPMGGGAAFEMDTTGEGGSLYLAHAQINSFGTQGVPVLSNRFRFPVPIAIPKNATIEGLLYLSAYARDVIGSWRGPDHYLFNMPGNDDIYVKEFPMRFGIQMSLFGYRLVQQRGQYHK